MSLQRDISTFTSILRSRGTQASVDYLNAGVPHRYTGVYRIESGMFRNVVLTDKLGEIKPEYLEVVPFEASFCQFVVREGVFRTENSAMDARLDGHPYQGVVVCYHGVPMMGRDGELLGTLCHFDLQDHDIQDGEFQLLKMAGRVLPDFVPR